MAIKNEVTLDGAGASRALAVREQAGKVVTPERLDAASKAIALARTPEEVKTIRDKAEAMEVYERRRGRLREANQITTIRLEAERRLGEFLRSMPRNKGGRKTKKPVRGQDGLPTLKELGFTRNQASLWGQLAAIPKGEFRRVVDLLIQEERELGTRSVIKECGPHPTRRTESRSASSQKDGGELHDDGDQCFYFEDELPEELVEEIKELQLDRRFPKNGVIVGIVVRTGAA